MVTVQCSVYTDEDIAPLVRMTRIDDIPAILAKYAIDTRTPIIVNIVRDRKSGYSNVTLGVQLDESMPELVQILQEYREPRCWAELDLSFAHACEVAEAFVENQESRYPGLIIALAPALSRRLAAVA